MKRWSTFWERLEDELSALSKRSDYIYGRWIERFVEFCVEKRPCDITQADYTAFMKTLAGDSIASRRQCKFALKFLDKRILKTDSVIEVIE